MENVVPRACFTVTRNSVIALGVACSISALFWCQVGALLLYLR